MFAHFYILLQLFYLRLIYRAYPASNYITLRKLSFADYERKIEDIIITTILWQYISLSEFMRRLLASSISFIA